MRSVLIMVEPVAPFARGQRRRREPGQQFVGVFGVGARQRQQHPGRRPGRQVSRADGGKRRIGQRRDQERIHARRSQAQRLTFYGLFVTLQTDL